MLLKISLLTGLIFAALYPLCFWISRKDPLKNNFHRFHLGLPTVVGGVVVVSLLFMALPDILKRMALLWEAVLLLCTAYFWKKETVDLRLIAVPCFLGVYVFSSAQIWLVQSPWYPKDGDFDWTAICIGLLSGFILCSSIFAMNLGHWYLNVHGLPISHLIRTVRVFGFFLVLRIVWDLYSLWKGLMSWDGQAIPLFQFIQGIEGIFVWMAIFFGSLFPLITLYFVNGTLKVKSTQSATGILYVILIAVLIGDLTYKYYLFRYGIAL